MTRNNDDIFNLRERAVEREKARGSLKDNFSETKERMRPANLIRQAKDKTRERVQQTGERALAGVKSRPGITVSVAAAAGLVLLRKPVTQFIVSRLKQVKTKPESKEK